MNDELGATRLGHGIARIGLPLPFPRLRAVNSYVIEASQGLVLIDCGIDWEPGYQALQQGMAAIGLELGAVNTIVVTHLHPDHVGMVPRLAAQLDCPTIMHKRAVELVPRYNDTAGFVVGNQMMGDRHGITDSARPEFIDTGPRPEFMPFIEPPERVVEDGDHIELGGGRHLKVSFTPGHEPCHICLFDSRSRILFSGDHILPRITPTVGVDEAMEDAIGTYLESLRRVVEMKVGVTYPAHGGIVERGSERAAQIILHHERRLEQMLEEVVARPSTAWMVMERVFRPHLSPLDQRLALRETVAHLEHLRVRGRLTADDRRGVLWYRRS